MHLQYILLHEHTAYEDVCSLSHHHHSTSCICTCTQALLMSLHILTPPTPAPPPCPAPSPVSDEGVVVSLTGMSVVHHDATQSVFSALWTLLRQGTVRATVLLNHLTWGRGGEGRGRVGVTVCKESMLGEDVLRETDLRPWRSGWPCRGPYQTP